MPIAKRVELYSKILLIITTIYGLGWGLWEYSEARRGDRVERTLAYVDRFGKAPVSDARKAIAEGWYAVRSAIRELESTPVPSDAMFARRKRQLTLQVVRPSLPPAASLADEIDTVVDFYESLFVCVSSRICDEPTATRYFRPYAARFESLHAPFIEWKRRVYSKDYADGLRGIVTINQ